MYLGLVEIDAEKMRAPTLLLKGRETHNRAKSHVPCVQFEVSVAMIATKVPWTVW